MKNDYFFTQSSVFSMLVYLTSITLLSTSFLSAQVLNPINKLVQQHKSNYNFTAARLFRQLDDQAGLRGQSLQEAKNATHVTLDKTALKALYRQNLKAITFAVPFQNKDMQLELVQAEIFTPDFKVLESGNGDQPVPYQPGRYYRGIVQGDEHSVVAVSIFENEVYGIVSTKDYGNINIIEMPSKSLNREYVIFSDRHQKRSNPFLCHTDEEVNEKKSNFKSLEAENGLYYCWDKYIGVYLECDSALTNLKGGTIPTVNFVSALFNNVATIYWYEGISLRIPTIFIWTKKDDYAVFNRTSSQKERVEEKLDLFALKRKYLGHGLVWGVNIAQLLCLKPSTGEYGGLARAIDGLCEPEDIYSISELEGNFTDDTLSLAIPNYSWNVYIIAHEIGHTLGSPHTHSCCWPGGAIDNCEETEGSCDRGPEPPDGGTIMSYCQNTSAGINFKNGFGPYPGALIRQKVCNDVGCLLNSWDCNPPTDVKEISSTSCSVTLNWTKMPEGNYNLRYKRSLNASGLSNNWIYINGITPPYQLNGLAFDTYYDVELQSNCGYLSLYGLGTTVKTECEAIDKITVEFVTDKFAKLSWSSYPMANRYAIVYSAKGIQYSIETSSNSILLENLEANTFYDGYIVNQCKCGDSYQKLFYFTTEPPCPAPTNLRAINATCQTITLDWTRVIGAESYTLEYRRIPFASSWETVYGNPPYTITGLVLGSTYEVQVRSNCSKSPNTSKIASISVNTQTLQTACCPPDELRATNIKTTSALVSWDVYSFSGNRIYNVQYRKAGTTVFRTVTSGQQTSLMLSGLSPNTTYEFKVMMICSSGFTFSRLESFTTNSSLLDNDNSKLNSPSTISTDYSTRIIKLSPNPASDYCKIELSTFTHSNSGQIEVKDMLGRRWLQFEWEDPSQPLEMNISQLPKGTYLIVYTDKNKLQGQQLLVK